MLQRLVGEVSSEGFCKAFDCVRLFSEIYLLSSEMFDIFSGYLRKTSNCLEKPAGISISFALQTRFHVINRCKQGGRHFFIM